MFILCVRNSLDVRGSILKNGWNSKVTPNFSSMLAYGEAAFGCCCEISIFLTLIIYKIIAEITNVPVGMISRAQRYKKAVKTEQEETKISNFLKMKSV